MASLFRLPRGWALPASTWEDPAVAAFALCLDCGAELSGWREFLLPIQNATFTLTERGEMALRVDHQGACLKCGGGHVEIRVEKRNTALA